LFIDDNPSNLAEAQAVVPGIQVEDQTFICRMLDDPRFKGKDDAKLSRLAQYKLLETRKRDEVKSSGDNQAFLRGCDIRVYIEHDVFSHLDRAIELISRTNQLNFTKGRLPKDPEVARAKCRKRWKGSHRQAGLVRVIDKYGDYGFVGFYLLHNRRSDPAPGLANQTLKHYCFSCRTLGMFVEQWLYDQLRRPQLTVVGEVLTDLSEERTIDWIRLVESDSHETQPKPRIAPEIRITGGCEANSVAHYLGAYCDRAAVTGNFQAGPLFVRVNSCALLLSAVNHAGPLMEQELAPLGIPAPLLGTDYFRDAPEGTIFVFSGGLDAFGALGRVRHRLHGWEIHVTTGDTGDFISASEDEIDKLIMDAGTDEEKQQLEFVTRHIRENYKSVGADETYSLDGAMLELVARVPQGCKLIILLDDERRRTKKGEIRIKPQRVSYNQRMQSFAAQFPFVATAWFRDAIENEDEILKGGNHYARMVYWRVAERIIEIAGQIEPKRDPGTLVQPPETGDNSLATFDDDSAGFVAPPELVMVQSDDRPGFD
jgi:hypothetical protein